MTKPHPPGACRGRSAGAMRRSPAPSALANQSPPASSQDSRSRGTPNPFGTFRNRSPDDFRLRPKPDPSVFGNFRKPGRDAAECIRAFSAQQGRLGGRRAAALRAQPDMRLLSRALRAAQGYRSTALPPRRLRAGPVGWPLPARRGLSVRPGLEQLFAEPSLHRLLEARTRGEGGAAPQLAARVRRLRDKERELQDTRELARDENEDFRKLAEAEIACCEEEIAELKHQIVLLLIPSEETDESDLVMEVTAGVGGQEAMLFTSEIFDMYQRYAAYKKWKFEVLEYFPSEIGGLRHAVASIAGVEAYKYMKFEGGVHRVQRVPKTEKQGRIHTSTMTVAILPQPTEMSLQINPKDLRIETKRASGAGGQHVNTTDSAVRIVHIPTGIVSECQQERSQIRNKEKAMQMLYAKLYSTKLEEETKKRNSARKIQIGTKGRSEKIRTYNFPQDRITDHRISRSVYHVESFMQGEEMLDEMIQTLREYADYESLMEVISENEKNNSS